MSYKLPENVKKLWLKALRSGNYKQGQRYLKTYKKFCCLGVLCDVLNKENMVETSANQFQYSYPPRVVSEFLNIKTDTIFHNLASLNDNEGKNFNEIADYIEETY